MGKKVLLAGYYGFSNTGDEAILSTMLSELRSQSPGLEFIVVSGNPDETAGRYNVSSVLYTDWNAIIESVRHSALIILGGGGLFNDYWGFDPHTLLTRNHWSISYYSAFPLLATLLDKPLMLFAIGVGPLMSEASQKYTALAFDQAWVSTVRDIESKELFLSPRLDETRIKVTADPAFLIKPSPREQVIDLLESEGYSSSDQMLVGVSLRSWQIGVQQEKWVREVAEALDLVIERYKAKVVFVPFQRASENLTGDYAISNSVRNLMHNQSQTFTLEKDYTVEEKAGILAQCNFVLGMRLHSIIFAANAGLPVLGLVYDPKVRNVMRQLGCEKYAIDLSTINSLELLRLFADAHSNREAIAAQLQSAVESLRQLAKENIKLAIELFENPERFQRALSPEILDSLKGTTLNLALRVERDCQKINALEADHQQIINSLSAQMREQEQSLATQITDKEQTIQSLSSELAEKSEEIKAFSSLASVAEQYSRFLSSELAEKRIKIDALSSQASQAEHNARFLSSELAKEKEERQTLSSQAEQNAHSLSSQLATKERSIEVLSEQLAVKDQELRRITNTLGWRVLNRYGQIKYRYLLPVYKAFGLPPYDKKSAKPAQSEPPPLPDMVQTLGSSPQVESGALSQSLPEEFVWQGQTALNAYDVVCFPIIEWDFRFQRPQQLMSRFAEAGHRVFYISQNFYSSGPPYRIQEKQKNIFEVLLRGPQKVVYTDVMDDKARDSFFNSLDALRRDLLLGATVAVAQLPFWGPLVNKTRSRFAWPVVYDCMDYHAGFSTNEKIMIDQEHDLLTSADLVVVSSDFLAEQARQHNSNVLMVRNACEYAHFAKAGRAESERPVIGYYGAIADWFDADLVADIAERRPDWDFLLVGSTFSADLTRLSKLANVSLPGEKPYAEIPDWLTKFDVAIIPFQRTPLTEATNPVKAYEILASGKPIVSVTIPEVAALRPLVRLASTAEEFEKEIAAALEENDPELITKRRAFAREHTWEKRYEVLAPAVCEVFPKASIVIVTFNNVHLNRLCLESLYACTEWPNFEVFVVDNASADATPGYLQEAEKRFPNLRVILNDSNLGFAAANNIGLKLATGDYLVLLNNDTVVTRGWLSALIRHLHANPQIGMVGPVTNAIGNEAKLEVDYTRLEDMPRWAANYVRNHDGQIFPIAMLAMFCVVIRREVFEKVGLLDERFGVGMFEDDDYCHRLEALGYELRCARDSFIHHWQRASFRLLGEDEYARLYEENRNRYEGKWQEAPVYLNPVLLEKAKSLPPVIENETPPIEEEALPVEVNEPLPVEVNQAVLVEADSDQDFYRFQLQGVLAKVEESKGAIIFLPSVGWNIHLFQRPHHLAREFARQGYTVIFDSSNSHDEVKGFKEIEANLFLFHGPEDLLYEIPGAVLWAFPYNFDRKDAYPDTARTIYDWIDDLEVFPYDRDVLESNHSRALNEATLVVSVAGRLHRQALAVRSDAVYLPNAVEYERFATEVVSVPEDIDTLLRENKPIAGYYGALAEWFDYQLLDEVARLRPDWNFLLIGQTLDQSFNQQPVFTRRNVIWIGPRHYESLPQYLKVFDVAMIPFVINNITLATSPLKLYEYFAGSKAVITTPMPECEGFAEVTIARNAEEFADALDKARELGRDEEFRARVRALAQENSWTIRVQTVEKLLQRRERANEKATHLLRR